MVQMHHRADTPRGRQAGWRRKVTARPPRNARKPSGNDDVLQPSARASSLSNTWRSDASNRSQSRASRTWPSTMGSASPTATVNVADPVPVLRPGARRCTGANVGCAKPPVTFVYPDRRIALSVAVGANTVANHTAQRL